MIRGVRRMFLYQGFCDMHRSFDRLAYMVRKELGEDPLTGDVYIFLNKNQRMMKCLYWDSDGYALWYKQLEKGRFIRPKNDNKELDELAWAHLLSDVEVKIIKKQSRYTFLK